MSDWEHRFARALATLQQRERGDFIDEIADLAFEVSEAQGDACLDSPGPWRAYRAATTKLYYEHIVAMETREVARLLAASGQCTARYAEMASEPGRISYQRVADMFAHVDFHRCRRFVMVGCGQLPVTALHVMDCTEVTDMVLLDVSAQAVEAVRTLGRTFGWEALKPVLCSGADFDFGQADVVYVGNMVSPKVDTVNRVLATAPDDVQIVVREPYSLGRLWAEKVEPLVSAQVEVTGRGPVSRHLSRDIYMRKRASCR